ncbi:MAG: DMT family transporter [Candidatus Cloacimonetes bacterium]|nr:DMT family transporter [Candidatus Cloacimonadota bacterium]
MKKSISLSALFFTSAIWGFAFVAQRQGMESLDPFLFNSIRFALGALVVGLLGFKSVTKYKKIPWNLGIVLFMGASLQQTGLIWTTAGNAGFITGLYVVFVPILGLFRNQRLNRQTIYAISLATIGLYLINDNRDLTVSISNALILVGALFWAIHLQLVDKLIKRYDTLYLAFTQFAICAILSLIVGLIYNLGYRPETFLSSEIFSNIGSAGISLLYSGLISVGIAYTLQVFAQRQIEPTKAAIILCLESVFALLGGWLILSEQITFSLIIGASLILLAMIISIRVKPAVIH